MDYIIICFAAFLGSGLTFFSGFGLGTVLLPIFGIFFPIELAITLTAIIHFLNNLFKLVLVGNKANKQVVISFGIPSIIAAFIGAYTLTFIVGMRPLFTYSIFHSKFELLPVKLIIALLLIIFALFDIVPSLKTIQFNKKYLPAGGFLSGFFGGLSGNQGALRSAFLIRANLTKEAFIATGVVIACLIDISRLLVYSKQIIHSKELFNNSLIIAATLSAFAGAYSGNRLLKKITISFIQYIVAAMIFIFSILLALGLI